MKRVHFIGANLFDGVGFPSDGLLEFLALPLPHLSAPFTNISLCRLNSEVSTPPAVSRIKINLVQTSINSILLWSSAIHSAETC